MACYDERMKIWQAAKKTILKIWHDIKYSFKIRRVFKKLIQNLTRRKYFNSKSCFLQKFFLSNSCFLEKKITFKIMFFFGKFSFFKIVLFIIGRKTQNMRILRCKLIQTWSFVCKTFFKICFLKLNFSSKSWFSKKNLFKLMLFKNIFFLKIWRVVKLIFQNLTRCVFFNPKSDAL